MVKTNYLLAFVVFAGFPHKAVALRGPYSSQQPKLEMHTFSLPKHKDASTPSAIECMIGLAGEIIAEGTHSTIYALDKSQLDVMDEKYAQDRKTGQIFEDLGVRMERTKQYVIKLNWKDTWKVVEHGVTEFAAHAEAAELGVAPQLVAGWVCQATRQEGSPDFIGSVLVMEQMKASLESLYVHVCKKFTEAKRSEVTRVAALAQRAALGVLERLAQRGLEHKDAYIHNFMLDSEGRVRAIDFGKVEIDTRVDTGHEARKLRMFRHSLGLLLLGNVELDCLEDELEASTAYPYWTVGIGKPWDWELGLLGLGEIEAVLTKRNYWWTTFQRFVDTPLGKEPLVYSLLKPPAWRGRLPRAVKSW